MAAGVVEVGAVEVGAVEMKAVGAVEVAESRMTGKIRPSMRTMMRMRVAGWGQGGTGARTGQDYLSIFQERRNF